MRLAPFASGVPSCDDERLDVAQTELLATVNSNTRLTHQPGYAIYREGQRGGGSRPNQVPPEAFSCFRSASTLKNLRQAVA